MGILASCSISSPRSDICSGQFIPFTIIYFLCVFHHQQFAHNSSFELKVGCIAFRGTARLRIVFKTSFD
jgi:hypothetical protein